MTCVPVELATDAFGRQSIEKKITTREFFVPLVVCFSILKCQISVTMALKKWMKKFQPLSLYIILTLTIFYFVLQLVVSNITHALTLTIDSYLMLCNLMALFGCIITIKICNCDEEPVDKGNASSASTASDTSDEEKACKKQSYGPCSDQQNVQSSVENKTREWRLKNTFGWARIDVLVMLMGCVTFASLCFSTVLEAFQTLFHISHQDQLHYPILVFCVGAFGLVLNGLCYLFIGGYTFHHGSCLRITSSGAVVLGTTLPSGQRKLNLRSECDARLAPGPREMCRDVIGCISVMICSAVVHFFDPEIGKWADPVFAIISAFSLIILTYPYMKESCCVLLQTIPNHINIDVMCRELTKDFPDVLNVHDLHVWQFSKGKTICTAHIIFLNPQVYTRIKKKVMDFFHEQGITTVTIQPEFFKDSNCLELISTLDANCLVKCLSPDCYQRYCCDLIGSDELKSICISVEQRGKTDSREQPIALRSLPNNITENGTSHTEDANSDAHTQASDDKTKSENEDCIKADLSNNQNTKNSSQTKDETEELS